MESHIERLLVVCSAERTPGGGPRPPPG